MSSYTNLLEVNKLNTRINQENFTIYPVSDFELLLRQEEIVAILGESGCGKTMSALSITGLVPKSAKVIQGKIMLEGNILDPRNETQMEKIRGSKISYVFQDATSYLNPIFTIGDQINEMVTIHQNLSQEQRRSKVCSFLELVDLKPADKFYWLYPHQLSGGMNQRAMIAMALASNPKILIADEPTSNLDRITELKILKLLLDLKNKLKISIIFITHNISTIENFADSIIVMYAGRIVEIGTKEEILSTSHHPYTKGLLNCIPKTSSKGNTIPTIKGNVPDLSSLPQGCKFHPRCPFVMPKCREKEPEFYKISNTHYSKCYLQQKI